MKNINYYIGKMAETKAINYLQNSGWFIINNNYKTPYGEIDIIASKINLLTAFEVKTRKNINTLYYSISNKQKIRIANSLLLFISINPKYNTYILRFDALLILGNKIKHIENAWSYNE